MFGRKRKSQPQPTVTREPVVFYPQPITEPDPTAALTALRDQWSTDPDRMTRRGLTD